MVKVFSLRGESEYTYEPFEYIREASELDMVSNMRELVGALLPIPANTSDPFWIQSSREYLTGGLLYYYDLNPESSFIGAAMNIMTTPPATLIHKIAEYGNDQIKSFVNNFIDADNTDSKLLVGIGQEVTNRLSIIVNDPRVRKALSPSEKQIRWTDLELYNIFLSVPEDRLEQYSPIVTMMLTQLIRSLERRHEKHSPEGKPQRRVLVTLDELPRLGKIDAIASAVATLRSKNVILCLVFQSLAQLDAVYGREVRRIIMDNCSYLAVLNVNDVESQKYFADRAGTRLVKRVSKGTNYVPAREADDPTAPVYREVTGYNEQESETREYIIQPHEFATLKDIVFFTPNNGHIRVKKNEYYKTDAATKIREGIVNTVHKVSEVAAKVVSKVNSFVSSCVGLIKRNFFGFGRS